MRHMSSSLASGSAIYTKCEHSVNVFHMVFVMVAFGAGKIRALENISLYSAYGSLRLSTSRSKIEINPRKLLSTRTVLASWEHYDVLSSPKTSLTIITQTSPPRHVRAHSPKTKAKNPVLLDNLSEHIHLKQTQQLCNRASYMVVTEWRVLCGHKKRGKNQRNRVKRTNCRNWHSEFRTESHFVLWAELCVCVCLF